jgi:hypothetical protein
MLAYRVIDHAAPLSLMACGEDTNPFPGLSVSIEDTLCKIPALSFNVRFPWPVRAC